MNNEQVQSDHDLLIELRTELRSLRDEVKDMRDTTIRRVEKIEGNYVTREEFEARTKALISKSEFWPVKVVVYGMIAIILSTVIGLIVRGVVIK